MPALEKSGLLDKINGLGEQAASGTGIEIVEIQLRGAGKARLLRVFIDKPQGVTHGDCEIISERLGALIDADESVLQEGYTLEVSSPGVERQLSKPRDFERVVGQKIRLGLRQPIDGQQRFEGKLTGFAGDTLEVEVAPEQILRIPREQIQKANLKFEW
jgi:ribosome maturation factor RimP